MAERFSYAIVGRGRWAARMRTILEREGREIACFENARMQPAELTDVLQATGAQAAWLCVSPGPHVAQMIQASIDAGLHLVIEKPWMGSAAETEALTGAATARNLRLAVHFEYCLLDAVESWRERFHHRTGLEFGGHFTVSRAGRHGISALLNLGSHLAAIRRYAVPQSEIAELVCAYETVEERRVWIDDESLDFLDNREPIVERFVRRFENLAQEFPFDLGFGRLVAEDLATYLGRQTAPSPAR